MEATNGRELRRAFVAATRSMERYRDAVNALNVFPVPDGDTGTNMLLTLRSALERCPSGADATAGEVAAGLADGSFWGARGNSGVILSQFFKGFADGLKDKGLCNGADLARAFGLSSEAAYKAVGQPVEGTMLTVIRRIAEAAQQQAAQGEDSATALWNTAFLAGREALYRTPEQLPVLAEAGVVDAGGMGVMVILGGALCYLTGQGEEGMELDLGAGRRELLAVGISKVDRQYLEATEHAQWGYCTQFLIAGDALEVDEIRQQFSAMATSAVVIGSPQHVRVHVHAFDPGPLISLGISLGQLSEFKIENMNLQHQDFVAGQRAREEPPAQAVVAVVAGDGMTRLFRESGCDVVVNGGQTMNPSVLQLLDAIHAGGARDTIVLTNNKNIVPTARQAAEANKHIHVVPSRSVPQGVAALLAYNSEESLERNLAAMGAAIATVVTIEVTRAVRRASIGGVTVEAGQSIALIDDKLSASGETPELALKSALAQIGLSADQVITLYRGMDTPEDQATELARQLAAETPGIQVELIYGGQPHYHYLASVE